MGAVNNERIFKAPVYSFFSFHFDLFCLVWFSFVSLTKLICSLALSVIVQCYFYAKASPLLIQSVVMSETCQT